MACRGGHVVFVYIFQREAHPSHAAMSQAVNASAAIYDPGWGQNMLLAYDLKELPVLCLSCSVKHCRILVPSNIKVKRYHSTLSRIWDEGH
jgi:hypothetical protein